MKRLAKVLVYSVAVAAAVLMTVGCSTPYPFGTIYTKVDLPVAVGNSELQWSRKGTASCYSILGLIANGDASINNACKNGGITKVSWVTYSVNNILGAYGIYTTTVYGD